MPLVLGLGVPELLIILAVVLLLFGGSRLAGLGKSTGRALKEFKEETKGLKSEESQPPSPTLGPDPAAPNQAPYQQLPQSTSYQQPPAGGVQDSSGTDPRKNL